MHVSGAHDYRDLANRPDVLTFDSAPLERDTEVTGPIHAQIYFSCDCRDTDLWVRLLDVASDGTAFNLMSPAWTCCGPAIAMQRKGGNCSSRNRFMSCTSNNLITSNVFLKGHRIRVQVSATFFPNFSRNLQTGDLEASSARMQKANISIYTDRRRPSRVVLPVTVNYRGSTIMVHNRRALNARFRDTETRRISC